MSRAKLSLWLQPQLVFAAMIASCIVVFSTSVFGRQNSDSAPTNLMQNRLLKVSGVEQVVLQDALNQITKGKRQGGQFVAGGGWQVTGVEDMIVYDLGRYLENGSVELEARNFNPREQNSHYRHHFLSMFKNPWGNHHPVEDQETLWDLHAGYYYDGGLKMLSWTYDANTEKSTVLQAAWESKRTHHLKIVWKGKQLQYFLNGTLYLTHTHTSNMELRYLFLGRDFTVGADLVTGFKHNQYPALVGPIYANLVVKENLTTDDEVPPQIDNVAASDLYSNAVRLAWTTNEPAVCRVEYGLSPQYTNKTPVLGRPSEEHSTTLDRLAPNQTYHYRIIAIDKSGRRAVSDEQIFTTTDNGAYLFKPSADTYVERAGLYGSTRDYGNFGWMNLLAGKGRESYLRFRVAGLDGEVRRVSLRLHARQAPPVGEAEGQLTVYALKQAWNEMETTWRTKPFVNGNSIGSYNGVSAEQWHEMNLKSGITKDGTFNFALLGYARQGDGDDVISFDSRESTNFQPELIIETQSSGSLPTIVSGVSDDFNDGILDSNKWRLGANAGNQPAIIERNLALRSSGSQSSWIITRHAVVARNNMATIKVSQPSGDGCLGLSPTYTPSAPHGIYTEPNWYRFYTFRSAASGPYRLYAAWSKNGKAGDSEVTGNLVINGPVYLRLRCDESTIYFEASFDNVTWITAYSEIFSLPGYTLQDAFQYELAAYRTDKNGVMMVDDFSITPSRQAPADTIAPEISQVAAINLTGATAMVVWNTDEPAYAQVEYGSKKKYGSKTALTGELNSSHAIVLTDLSPNITYHYRVISQDALGNRSVSPDLTFITSATTTAILDDDFNSGQLDRSKWFFGANSQNRSTVDNKVLELRTSGQQTGWVITKNKFLARQTVISVKVTQPNDDGNLGMSPTYTASSAYGIYSEENWYRFYTYRNKASGDYHLFAGWRKNGVLGGKDVTPTGAAGNLRIKNAVYLRLRLDDRDIHFEASTDGKLWVDTYSEPFALPGYTLNDAFYYELAAYYTKHYGELQVDDFSIKPSRERDVAATKAVSAIIGGEETSGQPYGRSPAGFAENLLPSTWRLDNYPNPFNVSTRTRFELPEAAEVILTVFDLAGREVQELKTATLPAGRNELIWNGQNREGQELSSGMYLLQMRYRPLSTITWSQIVRRMTILR